jgi:hypothetical protein
LHCLTANLQGAIEALAPLKTVASKKKSKPWIGPELSNLIARRNAVHRRYQRTGRAALLSEFLTLRDEIEERTEVARCDFLREQIGIALDESKDMWEEMRHLGLLPKPKEALHGFGPDELNAHFASVSVSPLEEAVDVSAILNGLSDDGFKFKPITSTT